jgi:hypothetical protein
MPGLFWSFFIIEGVLFNLWATSAVLHTFLSLERNVDWKVFIGYAWQERHWFNSEIAAALACWVAPTEINTLPALVTCLRLKLGVVKLIRSSESQKIITDSKVSEYGDKLLKLIIHPPYCAIPRLQ